MQYEVILIYRPNYTVATCVRTTVYVYNTTVTTKWNDAGIMKPEIRQSLNQATSNTQLTIRIRDTSSQSILQHVKLPKLSEMKIKTMITRNISSPDNPTARPIVSSLVHQLELEKQITAQAQIFIAKNEGVE